MFIKVKKYIKNLIVKWAFFRKIIQAYIVLYIVIMSSKRAK